MNDYLAAPVRPADVVHSYAGVRPLYDDGRADASAVTRDYVLRPGGADAPGLLSVFGGKITTYRRLAEHALEQLAGSLPAMGGYWTDRVPLPGGDLPQRDAAAYTATVRRRWPFLSGEDAHRLVRSYGTRVGAILGDATGQDQLGEQFGGGLTTAEVDYLTDVEWARTPEDILWRRSKIGLHSGTATVAALGAYLERRA